MALDKQLIGRAYGPFTYTLGVEKMREFTLAVGGGQPGIGFGRVPAHISPLMLDEQAAKAGPYGDIIAFPSFAVVFAIRPFSAAIADPELQVDLLKLVHGEQELEFLEVMRPGDVLTTTGRITDIYEKMGKDFLVVTTESHNAKGTPVVRGTWTAVIRR
ncbi:MaoC family dehydratase N-terminal domain-containing protein [Stigmatella sp. ncwal1]|uniref:MaoC family dehydratase N-terminal domain-containing protein n=1 Tax=Stigmatella ashevillensis TaxID=2995309 RepID=A0ABT5D6B6_9BACT|nr:MaoC family dehydratase N-terminal domain-containing protein [Stigmatella ashevillena]MDC0708408.1 MaoC family dehydratase N-terminal domain-containing protein [Stigmatella ashevillena]